MLTKVLETIEKYNMISEGEHIVCALSGGADSSVLLSVLTRLSGRLGVKVSAVHLNHMLRGEEANADEAFCEELCASLGVELISERIDVSKIAEENGKSFELAARDVRYDFFACAKARLGADKIATAHNANDNIETVIFNLARGTGIDGVCGIPPVRGDIIRPIIELTRGDIEQYATENGIAFCIDKTNSDVGYSRNRIRHMIIPELQKLNPAAVENVSRTSSILREEAEFLRLSAEKAKNELSIARGVCEAGKLASLHSAIFVRVCVMLAREGAKDDNYSLETCHINNIRRLAESLSPSGELALPKGIVVRREYDKLVFEKRKAEGDTSSVSVSEGEFCWGEYVISVKKEINCRKIHNSLNTFFVPCDTIQQGLVVRSRMEGDTIKLPRRPEKTLKKLFIETRIPKNKRDGVPVLACNDGVIAVYGFGQSEKSLQQENGEMLIIEINKGVGK